MVELQPATPADREAVLGLVRAYFAFDVLAYEPPVEAALDDLLSNPAFGTLLLAREDGALVGYAALTYGFDHEAGGRIGVVTDLFLIEAARGRGLGRTLLGRIVDRARAQGLRRLELWVIEGNERARGLYESVGFEAVRGRTAMARELSPPGAARVRPATPEDVGSAMAAVAATGMLDAGAVDEVAVLMATHLEEGPDAEALWLVVDEGNGPTGVAYCAPERFADGVWNTLMIAVHPDRQAHGLGGALMAGVERTVAARGARLLLVETSGAAAFAAARRFYRGLGYEQEARIRDFYRAGDDKVLFRKLLRPFDGG